MKAEIARAFLKAAGDEQLPITVAIAPEWLRIAAEALADTAPNMNAVLEYAVLAVKREQDKYRYENPCAPAIRGALEYAMFAIRALKTAAPQDTGPTKAQAGPGTTPAESAAASLDAAARPSLAPSIEELAKDADHAQECVLEHGIHIVELKTLARRIRALAVSHTTTITYRFDSDCIINGEPVKAGTVWGPFTQEMRAKPSATGTTGGDPAYGAKGGGGSIYASTDETAKRFPDGMTQADDNRFNEAWGPNGSVDSTTNE